MIVEPGDRWINPLDSNPDRALTSQIRDQPEQRLVAREIGRCLPFLTKKRARL